MRGEGAPEARLTCYRAGEQAPHSHPFDEIPLLLAGEMQERTRRWDVDLCRPALGFKPAGTVHANRWGPDGALIFSVRLPPDAACELRPPGPGWTPPVAPGVLRALARRSLQAEEAAQRREFLWDFVAVATDAAPIGRVSPPGWVAEARARLRDEPQETSIARLAAAVGVHRVHLARAFARCYGLPPSLYRSRCRAMKAVAAAAATAEPLSHVAQASGFYDQSHAARIVRRETGFNLSELRALARLH